MSKKIKDIIFNCPLQYNQNIKKLKNNDELRKNCYKKEFMVCTAFELCKHYKNRLKCWEKYLNEFSN